MHNILSEDETRKETVDTEDETCKETEETDDDSKGSISDEIVDTVEIPRTDKVEEEDQKGEESASTASEEVRKPSEVVDLQFWVTTPCHKGAIQVSSLYLCQFNLDIYELLN